MEQALDKINVLEAQNKIVTAELTAAKSERDQANSVLNAQIRAKYMDKLRAIGTLPETVLHRMSNDQLENEIAVLERNKRSNSNNNSQTQQPDVVNHMKHVFARFNLSLARKLCWVQI